MTNVFDLIEEFYTQDEEWNSVLQQGCAEDFLRYKTDAAAQYAPYVHGGCRWLSFPQKSTLPASLCPPRGR